MFELLGKLGIDPQLLLAQIINFAILLWLLKKLVYTPLVNRIEKDEAELESSKIESEKLAKEKDDFRTHQKLETSVARKKARDIINEAESMAKKIRDQAQQESAEEKEKVIAQIRSRLNE